MAGAPLGYAMKKFKLRPEEIVDLVPSMGGCLASDRITVDGKPVGFMSCDPTERNSDSGWSFFAGDETQAYMDDAANFGIYDVNTIANCDRGIIPFLYALPGQRFEREQRTGEFVEAADSKANAAQSKLPAGITVVQGRVQIRDGWTFSLKSPFRRRLEDGSHVFWRPGVTFWVAVEKTRGESIHDKGERLRGEISLDAFDVKREEQGGVSRLSYRLAEDSPVPALYAFVIADGGNVHVAAYFDREEDTRVAQEAIQSFQQK